jgi:hypothetical protein
MSTTVIVTLTYGHATHLVKLQLLLAALPLWSERWKQSEVSSFSFLILPFLSQDLCVLHPLPEIHRLCLLFIPEFFLF